MPITGPDRACLDARARTGGATFNSLMLVVAVALVDVDGRVLLDLPLVAGQIVRARVTAAQPYDLFAAVTGSPDGPLALAAEPDL